jgi:uncharacterized protein (DUF433 family)
MPPAPMHERAGPARANPRLYLPAYRYAEAARLAGTTAPTIARWYRGYRIPGHRMRPVLGPAPPDGGPFLSYLQLVEVAFVASFRHLGVRLEALRRAHEYCRRTFDSEYPFAELRFKTDGARVLHVWAGRHDGFRDDFWRHGRLIATDLGGQLMWPEAIADRASQFDYEDGLALRWHPRGRDSPILVDPRIAFGAPMIADSGVPTSVIRDRFKAGETLAEIEDDFDRTCGKKLPQAFWLLNVDVQAHHKHFRHNEDDDVWLAEVGRQGWIVVTNDKRIRFNASELRAIVDHKVGCIVFTKGTLPRWEMMRLLARAWGRHPAAGQHGAPAVRLQPDHSRDAHSPLSQVLSRYPKS